MLARHGLEGRIQRRQLGWHAIGPQRFASALLHPAAEGERTARQQRVEHQLLVVAGNCQPGMIRPARPRQDPLDHLPRVGPPIDQVAEEHDLDGPATLGRVGLDLQQQVIKQPVHAVDVANRVDDRLQRHRDRHRRNRAGPVGVRRGARRVVADNPAPQA